MAETYQIKKGDTLGAIAQKFGTTVGNISGFRSGDPDLIFPGETITIGTDKPTTPSTPATDRAGAIRGELATTPDVTADVPEPTVDFNKYQADLAEATKQKGEAFEELKGFRTKRYDELREERGLETNRTEIDSLDKQISQKKMWKQSKLVANN